MFEKMKELDGKELGWAINAMSSQFISHNMLGISGKNLNSISFDAALGLIESVVKMGFKVERIICDTVGPPEVYRQRI